VKPHLRGEPLGTIDLDCTLGPFRITGRLDLGMPAALVQYRYADVRAKDLLRAWIHHLCLGIGTEGRYPGRCVLLGKDRRYSLGPVRDGERLLAGLLEVYWRGMTMPLRLFPETARAYIASLLRGKTEEEALKAAGRTWSSDRGYSEGRDPYFHFCFGEADPLDGEFRELADAVLRPLLESAVEER
jgi:exodeoxyribonuclease V gamma subunit